MHGMVIKMTKGTCHCGACQWTMMEQPDRVTACNCAICVRYGVLWAYGWEGESITVSGERTSYVRADLVDEEPGISFDFCPTCGNVICWRALEPGDNDNGRIRIAVNIRLAPSGTFDDVPIRHFDGADSFAEKPDDGRCVKDMWY